MIILNDLWEGRIYRRLSEYAKGDESFKVQNEELNKLAYLFLFHYAKPKTLKDALSKEKMLYKKAHSKFPFPKEIVQSLIDYAQVPASMDQEDFDFLKSIDVKKLFKNADFCYDSTQLDESIFWLIAHLFDIKKDKTAEIKSYYFDDFNFNVYYFNEYNLKATSILQDLPLDYSISCLIDYISCDDPREYDLIDIYYIDEYNSKPNKLFAFPPFFVRESKNTKGYERTPPNTIRSKEDKTEQMILDVLKNLKENVTAVILVSNSLFSRTYSSLRQKFIDEKILTKIIHLPEGTVEPKNVNTSLLVFERNKNNSGVKFVDLRTLSKKDSAKKNINPFASVEKTLVKHLLENEEPHLSKKISYSKIKDNNYGFNFADYDNQKIYEEEELIYADNLVAESCGQKNCMDKVYSSYAKPKSLVEHFVLGKEADIFVSTDITKIKFSPEEETISGHILRISDIKETRLQNSMEKIIIHFSLGKEFALKKTDVAIAKVLPPKVALYHEDKKIFPTPSFFIIRIKPDSDLLPCYLKAFFDSPEGTRLLEAKATGGGIKSISKTILEKLEIPYMPLEKQKAFEKEFLLLEGQICEHENKLNKLIQDQNNLFNLFNSKKD